MTEPESLATALVLIILLSLLTGGTALALAVLALGADVAMALASSLQLIRDAASESDLDAAADELSHVVITLTVAAFLAGVTRVVAKARSVKTGSGPSPTEPTPVAPAKPTPLVRPSGAPLNPTLLRLRQLPRSALLKEIRTVTGSEEIVLWEQVEYGATYRPCQAGPDAARLGVRSTDVIGYTTERLKNPQSAIMGLENKVSQELSPYGDVFLDYAPSP